MKIRSRLEVAILCAVAIISPYAEGVLDHYWIGLFIVPFGVASFGTLGLESVCWCLCYCIL